MIYRQPYGKMEAVLESKMEVNGEECICEERLSRSRQGSKELKELNQTEAASG